MADRTPEDLALGVLRIPLGDTLKVMPTLKARWLPEWAALFARPKGEPKALDEWTTADADEALLSAKTVGRVIDLIVAYDRTGALGGREWLEENADPSQLKAALDQMVGNAFPLADDPAGLASLVVLRQVVPSNPPSSMSGSSATGASTRTRSRRASTRSS
jgi:hypothetical protein